MMIDNVWIVIRRDYEDMEIVGVFTNEPEAKKYADFRNSLSTKLVYGESPYVVEKEQVSETCAEQCKLHRAKLREIRAERIEWEKKSRMEAEKREAERQAFLKEFPPVTPEDLDIVRGALSFANVVEYCLHKHTKGIQIITKKRLAPNRETIVRSHMVGVKPKVEFCEI